MNRPTGMPGAGGARTVLEFGQCRVVPETGELFVEGVRVPLGGRAFAILAMLLEARGGLVTKDEIFARVWPSRVVEENTLHVQMSFLRKALGADARLLKTVAGRGYRFEAEVAVGAPLGPGEAFDAPMRGNIPAPLSALIGRETELFIIMGLAVNYRLITLSGMGGIGKTRLALDAARALAPHYPDGAWLVDLTPLGDLRHLTAHLAASLELEPAGIAAPGQIAAALAGERRLILLDNCDHCLLAVAELAEALLHSCPGVQILATSREPLQVEGEFVYRVDPLSLPSVEVRDPAEMLVHGAIRLFVTRVQHLDPRFPFDSTTAEAIAETCRRLDGIPLAIELAAARAITLGVASLPERLADRFALLTNGSRTALARHRTLRAAIDWSHDLLAPSGQAVLRDVSIFAGRFSLESAVAVASGDMPVGDIERCLGDLVSKSLVVTEFHRGTLRYRLLQTMRAYGLEKLDAAGLRDSIARRHALHFAAVFASAAEEWQTAQITDWVARYGPELADVRAALDWAVGERGDPELGASLTLAAMPTWMELSLLGEARERLEAVLHLVAGESREAREREMRLRAALAVALTFTVVAGPATGGTWQRVLDLATELENDEYRAAGLWGVWSYYVLHAEYGRALEVAGQFLTLARSLGDATNLRVAEHMIGQVLHYQGNLDGARRHFEQALEPNVAPMRRTYVIFVRIDQRIAASTPLAHVLWLQGAFDRALRLARDTVEAALASGHSLSLSYALAGSACRVAMFSGDYDLADRYTRMLLEESARQGVGYWRNWARCFEAMLAVKKGDARVGVERLRAALASLGGSEPWIAVAYGVLGEGLAAQDEREEALEALNSGLALCERTRQGWYLAELLRLKGEIGGNPARAEELFAEARHVARSQGALAWELRAALSLARLRRAQGRSLEVRALLSPVYARFTEGFTSPDLVEAAALLEMRTRDVTPP